MRSFTIIAEHGSRESLGKLGGRFLSKTPSGAARKAFSKLMREYNQAGKRVNSLEIHLRETTQNSSKKIFKYKVSRVPNKTEANWIDGVTFAFTTTVKALPLNTVIH